MTTRRGTSDQNMSNPNNEIFTPTQFDRLMKMMQDFKDLVDINNGVGNLEQNQTRPRINHEVIPNREPQIHVHMETHTIDQMHRHFRIDAPSFDDSLDPNKFLNWLTEFEEYCEYHKMEDNRWVGLARMKLEGQAKIFWRNQERLFRRQF